MKTTLSDKNKRKGIDRFKLYKQKFDKVRTTENKEYKEVFEQIIDNDEQARIGNEMAEIVLEVKGSSSNNLDDNIRKAIRQYFEIDSTKPKPTFKRINSK